MKDTQATTRSSFDNDAQQSERVAGALIGHLSGMVREASLNAGTARCNATQEQIAVRAYEIYCNTGRQAGHCESNWHQADKELRREIEAENASMRGDTHYLGGLQSHAVDHSSVNVMPAKQAADKLPPYQSQQSQPSKKR